MTDQEKWKTKNCKKKWIWRALRIPSALRMELSASAFALSMSANIPSVSCCEKTMYGEIERHEENRTAIWWNKSDEAINKIKNDKIPSIDRFDSLIPSLIDRTTCRLIDWLIDKFLYGSIDWLIDWFVVSWSLDGLIDWLIDWWRRVCSSMRNLKRPIQLENLVLKKCTKKTKKESNKVEQKHLQGFANRQQPSGFRLLCANGIQQFSIA